MKKAISIASKTPTKPLKRAWVNLGQNWGRNRYMDEGKTWVKWGWKIDPTGLDESWIKLGWKSAQSTPDKRRTESVQISVSRRGRDGYMSGVSLGRGLYNRRPKGDQYLTSLDLGTSVVRGRH